MCATVLGAFLAWFNSLSPAARRAHMRERALAYVDHPLVTDIIHACPEDVREAAEGLRNAIRRSTWTWSH